jgi:hypothetical protein
MKNDLLNLKSYLEKIWPILEYCTKEIIDKKTGKPILNSEFQKHIWYLYRQSFYGFASVLNIMQYYYSNAANLIFMQKSKGTSLEGRSLSNIKWAEQPIFDPNRNELILEHMYTGTMFRIDVAKLFEDRDPSIKEVAKLINESYKVCWITKDENKKLQKTKREGNLFEYYKKNGIVIDNI